MKIQFVSDVACPWCAVGLHALERALERIGPELDVELRFEPFELNPTLGPDGADAAQYLKAKYGIDDSQLARNREHIRARGAEVGFTFGTREHVWNTFDAHRLLHWAGLQSANAQRALKHALLQAYHGDGRNPGARDVLLDAAAHAGLDRAQAAAVVDGDAYGDDVRAAERFWHDAGITAVPAVVIDRRHLISGGQPSDVFERALRQLAAADGPSAGAA